MHLEAFFHIHSLIKSGKLIILVMIIVTTIEQRIRQPERQPAKTDDLIPIHKFLSVRRSQRCRFCEHNLSKPEYNPSSIKFKIHLGALYVNQFIPLLLYLPLNGF